MFILSDGLPFYFNCVRTHNFDLGQECRPFSGKKFYDIAEK